ncbi:MAG: GAF domain-containing protein [Saprospiraceae bacterium]|nr:GAF domain-containing protein [Saprospiraceae bacterium]
MSSVIHINPSLRKAAEILGEARKGMGLDEFPFETRLSMRPLVNKWMSDFKDREDQLKILYNEIKSYTDEHPSILKAYTDVGSLVKDHHPIIHLLLSSVFPVSLSENMYGYAAGPFMMEPFYITTALQNLLADATAELKFELFSEIDKIPYSIRACLIILEKYYKIPLDQVLPLLFSLQYEDTDMERFFKTTSMLDFLEVKTHGPAPEIGNEKLDFLLRNLNDADLWLETFSPDIFYFEGFYLAFMNDVTEVETLSRLRKLLLTSDSFQDYDTARMVANLTRVYLSMFDVEVGIFAIDYPFDKSLSHRYNMQYPIIDNHLENLFSAKNDNIYIRACKENKIQIISNLEQLDNPSSIELNFLAKGYKSLMVVPLRDHNKKVIGIIELAAPDPYVFTYVKRLKLKEILPLYDVAVEDSRNTVDNRIQNIIQEQFTNIHPSVLWKFSETAFNYLNRESNNDEIRMIEPVHFNNVYPIYGQIDINSSTTIRNDAVKKDLSKNLYLVSEILEEAYQQTRFHLLKKLAFEVSVASANLSEEFDINQETAVNNLLAEEINPVLKDIRIQYPDLKERIDGYFSAMDPDLEIVYEARKNYEYSLNKVNNTISRHLEEQELNNQKIIPHYFEKYKTDGIEYTMYVGQSLLQKETFNLHQLYNLRLWQLYSMVEIYRQLEKVRPGLPTDMTVSFLVLVFNHPLNITFRMEEKRFDVDTSYFARYEILKKRIDKACLAGRKERLTQKDKLVIVYLNDKDREEYLDYLQFLIDESLLESEIEEVEVERVQGIQGIKALRANFKS